MENKYNLTALKYKLLYIKSREFRDQVKDTQYLEKDYELFLEKFNELVDRLHMTDPTEIFCLYRKMVYNGYLSKGGIFIPQDKDNIDINSLMGINIINGSGVCRHLSKGLSDIYNYRNNNSGVLTTYIEEDKEHRPVYADIWSNHAITIVSSNNKSYIYDPLNNLICKKTDDDNLISNNNIKQKIIVSDLDRLNINSDIKNIKEMITLPQSKLEDNVEVYEDTIRRLKEEKRKLIEFSINNESLYNEINRKSKIYKESYDLKVRI